MDMYEDNQVDMYGRKQCNDACIHRIISVALSDVIWWQCALPFYSGCCHIFFSSIALIAVLVGCLFVRYVCLYASSASVSN